MYTVFSHSDLLKGRAGRSIYPPPFQPPRNLQNGIKLLIFLNATLTDKLHTHICKYLHYAHLSSCSFFLFSSSSFCFFFSSLSFAFWSSLSNLSLSSFSALRSGVFSSFVLLSLLTISFNLFSTWIFLTCLLTQNEYAVNKHLASTHSTENSGCVTCRISSVEKFLPH